MRPGAAIVALLVCAGCAASNAPAISPEASQTMLLQPVPTRSEMMRGEYQALAECSYGPLAALLGPGTSKVDLPASHQIKIGYASSGVQFLEVTFARHSARETQVSFAAAQTMAGPFPATERAFEAVKGCSPQ